MKLICILSICCATFALSQESKVQIAIVDNNQLTQKAGYQTLRDLEQQGAYSDALKSLKKEIDQRGRQLVDATTEDDLERINLEINFLRKKLSSLSGVAAMDQNRGNDRNVLTSLILKNFQAKYPIIIFDQGNRTYINGAIYQNVEEVDITDEVVALILKEAGPESAAE